MRRTKRRKSQQKGLSRMMGLLRAEQKDGHLKQMNFQELWDPCAQNKTSELSKQKRLSRILGLLCAEQNVENLKEWTFRNSGTPKCRKSQKMHFQEFWDSWSQNKTSEISKNALSVILGLLRAEQDVGNLKNCTFRNSGTPVCRTRRRKSQKVNF